MILMNAQHDMTSLLSHICQKEKKDAICFRILRFSNESDDGRKNARENRHLRRYSGVCVCAFSERSSVYEKQLKGDRSSNNTAGRFSLINRLFRCDQ